MKLQRQLHPDSIPGGGATLDVSAEAAPAAESAPTIPTTEPAKAPEQKFYSLEDLKNLKEFGDETKETVAAPEDKASKAPVIEKKENDEFTLDLEDTVLEESATEASTTWNMVAKQLEFEDLEEDSFDKFKEKVSAKISLAREEGKAEGQKLSVTTLPEDAKELFDFLSIEGNTKEMFLNPLSTFDKYLALDDKALLEEDFKLRGYDSEMLEEAIEDIELDGKIKMRAYEIRKALESGKTERQASLINEARNKITQRQADIINKEKAELESFKSSLQATKDFMGIPINERAYGVIETKFKDGFYRERLANDPKLAAEVALFIEFKEKARNLLGNDLRDEGRQQVLKTIKNVGLPGSSAGRVTGESSELKGFDVWEKKMAEEDKNRR